jgi:hypothetical protein
MGWPAVSVHRVTPDWRCGGFCWFQIYCLVLSIVWREHDRRKPETDFGQIANRPS